MSRILQILRHLAAHLPTTKDPIRRTHFNPPNYHNFQKTTHFPSPFLNSCWFLSDYGHQKADEEEEKKETKMEEQMETMMTKVKRILFTIGGVALVSLYFAARRSDGVFRGTVINHPHKMLELLRAAGYTVPTWSEFVPVFYLRGALLLVAVVCCIGILTLFQWLSARIKAI